MIFLNKNSHYICILCSLLFATDLFATKRTLDADVAGGADHTTFNDALNYVVTNNLDTLLITGPDKDSYTWTATYSTSIGSIVIKSTLNNPDSFPVITKTGDDYFSFMSNNNVSFENLIFDNSSSSSEYVFRNGQASGKVHSFKNCVIRNQSSDYLILLEGGNSTTTIFENCLFHNNNRVIHLNYWGGSPTVSFINCTFDQNGNNFTGDEDLNTNISFVNCIFSNNTTTFPGNNLRSKVKYSVTTETITGYDAGTCVSGNPLYVNGSRTIPSDWKITGASPASNKGTSTGAPVTDIGGVARSGGYEAGCWEIFYADYTWDISINADIQAGSGTWGSSKYWTIDGINLQNWMGKGNTATFAGIDGVYAVTVSGTQDVDSISFISSQYSLSGGSLNFTSSALIDVAPSKSAIISSVIAGSNGLNFTGGGTLALSGSNTYSGVTNIDNGGTIVTSLLTNGGSNSSIGISSSAASNLIINSGTLRFTGNASTSDRLFSIGTSGAAVSASGTGALNFSNAGALGMFGSGVRNLVLRGTNTGTNTLAALIGDNGGATSVTKSESGRWILSGTNTYTGVTSITGGTLQVSSLTDGGNNSNIGASTSSASNLLISGGTLAYSGAATTTNRLFTIGTSGATVEGSGSGAIGFTNTGSAGLSGSGARTLTISGTNVGSNTLAAVIGNNGGLTSVIKNGTGHWVLSGLNTFTGSVTLNAGVLSVSSLASGGVASNLGASTNSASNLVFDGGTLLYNGVYVDCNRLFTLGLAGGTLNASGTGALDLSNTGTVVLSGSGSRNLNLTGTNTSNNVLSSIIGDNGGSTSITKSSTGTWVIAGSNLYGGSTTINGGILVFSGSGSVYNNGTGTGSIIINNGGTVRLDRSDFLGDYGSIPVTTVTIHSGGTLSSNNSFNTLNNIVLNGGTLQSNGGLNATWPSFALKGKVFITGTATSQINDGSGTNNRVMVGSNTNGGTTDFDVFDNVSGNDLVISSVLADMREVGGSQTEVISGINKSGTGTMVLTANNIYRGPTTIQSGTLVFSTGGSVYNNGTFAGTIIINNSGTVRFDRSGLLGDHLSNPAATVTIHAGGVMASNTTFNTLNNLALNGGTVLANGGDATWGAFAFKGTLRAYGSIASNISTGEGSNNFIRIGTNEADGATIFDIADNAPGNDLVVSAVITNNKGPDPYPDVAGCLIKTGPGTMVLSSVNTYSGSTTVSKGTLLVNGSINSGSLVSVGDSATLGGSGIIGGSVLVADNGAVSPGNGGIGTLTTGTLGLNDQSILDFELGATNLSDKIIVNQGAANLTADGIFNITATAGFGIGTYTLIACSGLLTDNLVSLGTMPGGYGYTLQVAGNEVQLLVSELNHSPTDLNLSSVEIFEGKPINTIVGSFSTEDLNSSESFTYTLVSGTGDNDNGSFNINGNELRTSAVFGYDVKNSYNVRVRTTDHDGLFYEKALTINVVVPGNGVKGQYFDNSDLTDVKLTRTDNTVNFDWGTSAPDVSMGEDGFSVRWIGKIRPEYSENYTFYFNADDGVRLWVNDLLIIDQWINWTGIEYSGQIELIGGTLYNFKIEFYDSLTSATTHLKWASPSLSKDVIQSEYLYAPESSVPTDVSLSNASVYEDRAAGTTIGTLTTTDPDAGDSHIYSLVSGTGATDNANFIIDGNILKTNVVLHNATKSSHSIRIRTTDASGLVYEEVFTITVTNDPAVVTIDADGGADYLSLNSLLLDIQSGSNPTNIMFIGTDQDTYLWSQFLDRHMTGPVTFRGAENDPDKFPIINHTTTNCYQFLENLEITFEKLIFTGSIHFDNGQSSKTITFKNCIIRDFASSQFFMYKGSSGPTMNFENCLFEGNTYSNGILGFEMLGGSPILNITNCTFDNNTKIFSKDLIYGTNHSIKNCIFINNTNTFPGNILKGKTTFSLTSEDTTNYGTGCVKSSNPQFVNSTRNNGSDWRLMNSSPAKNIGSSTGAPTLDLGSSNRVDGFIDVGCWEFVPYIWDLQTKSGIQSGNGTWGTHNYWTREGTKLTAWPGAGYSAIFAGVDSTYSITVNGTQTVDSIIFSNNGYSLSSGILALTGSAGINVASSKNAVISSIVSGTNGLKLTGGGTLSLLESNTYTGVTSVTGGSVLKVSSLANGGMNSSIGAASASASNLIINNGTVFYTGSTIDVNRLFSIGNSGCTIDASGTGSLNLTGSGSLGFDGSGTRILTLTGAGAGSLSSVISDNVSATSLVKSGNGVWTLSGTNTYSGSTTVSAGTLKINGSITSAVTVNNGATLSGNGTISGTVDVGDGSFLVPGNSSTGRLATGSLTLNNSSYLNFELGTQRDSVDVNGNLNLNGVLNIIALNGFSAGTYTLFTCSGTITNNGLTVGTAPYTFTYYVTVENNKVILEVINHTELLPITVRHSIDSTTSSDTCLIFTDKWSIIFDEDNGGQIKFLSDQPDGAGTNQVWNTNQRNLFYVNYGDASYSTSGNLTIIEQKPFFIVLRNTYTLRGIRFNEEYTVYGSGRFFLKLTAVNNSGVSQNQILGLVTVRSNAGNSVRKSGNAAASLSPYLLNADASAGQFDILFCLNEAWTDANSFVNLADQNSYLGFQANPFTMPNGAYRTWNCMIDFAKTLLNDTSSSTTNLTNDYLDADSLEYMAGASAMDNAWEVHLWGHWKFDELSGSIAHDWSGINHHGVTNGSWVTGKRGGAIGTTLSQNVTVENHIDFDATWHFTVTAWIKTSSLNNTAFIIGKHDGTNGWKLTGNGSDKLRLLIKGTAFDGKKTVADNNWHHVAASFSLISDSVRLYVDGKVDTIHQTASNLIVTANSADLNMGGNYTGLLDDIRYFNNLPGEDMIRSIYLNNYNSAKGMYTVRANNNNMVYLQIDGEAINRFFPIFQIHNYWASALPANACVKINGITQVENSDYYAALDDEYNILTIGFNKTFYTDAVQIYIDDTYDNGYQMVGPVKKIYWGKQNNGTYDYFWVKNFPENSFGNANDNQYYLNWKMSTTGNSKDGDIWFMGSSISNPNTPVDTTANTNLIPGYDGAYGSLGSYSFNLNGNYPNTSEHTSNTFSYTVKESSSVRVVLRINERNVSNGNSFKIKTEWTIYPTGQIFKWDSIYQFSTTPLGVFSGAFMDDRSYSSLYRNTIRKRSGVIYSQNFQDFVYSWLSMKNGNGYQSEPFNSDTLEFYQDVNRVGFDFIDETASSQWNATPIETAVYIDMQHANMNSAFIDSASNSVQCIGINGGAALGMTTGILMSGDSSVSGDLNCDGFNESEGAYVIRASNNTVDFALPARNDTCRFYPVFRIKNYSAAAKPDYVFLYHGKSAGDTVSMLEDYQYSVYHNQQTRELIIQIDSIFCDSVKIYLSADRTLAVKMSGFWAIGGFGCDTIGWSTESEKDNLGFNLYRRIKPSFYENINSSTDSSEICLLKRNSITNTDTGWVQINKKLIAGVSSGVSYGRRDYRFIDKNVYNDILYEYKLISIDFSNKTEQFGPVEAMPRARIPLAFRMFNYPNPFRNSTFFHFELPYDSRITLDIYNLQGRLMRRLISPDKTYKTGFYQVNWDGTNKQGTKLGAGSYVYRIATSKNTKSRMIFIIK